MFLVGGGIIAHGLPLLTTWLHDIESVAHELPVAADLFSGLAAMVYNGIVGIVAGGILVGAHELVRRIRPKKA
jgi:predicted DNA repair protein MutK